VGRVGEIGSVTHPRSGARLICSSRPVLPPPPPCRCGSRCASAPFTPTQRKPWDYRLGFTGERVVGEELNQLLGSGFRVFHDVPFERFNIDHVLVGPPGMYAVETKSPRKRAAIKGLERATVQSTGTVLQFTTFNNTSFIEQARRNPKTLSEWLGKTTGQPVHVGPIPTLPGWELGIPRGLPVTC
jgi:hypothetical protein